MNKGMHQSQLRVRSVNCQVCSNMHKCIVSFVYVHEVLYWLCLVLVFPARSCGGLADVHPAYTHSGKGCLRQTAGVTWNRRYECTLCTPSVCASIHQKFYAVVQYIREALFFIVNVP